MSENAPTNTGVISNTSGLVGTFLDVLIYGIGIREMY